MCFAHNSKKTEAHEFHVLLFQIASSEWTIWVIGEILKNMRYLIRRMN